MIHSFSCYCTVTDPAGSTSMYTNRYDKDSVLIKVQNSTVDVYNNGCYNNAVKLPPLFYSLFPCQAMLRHLLLLHSIELCIVRTLVSVSGTENLASRIPASTRESLVTAVLPS
jgi:hypothetical protein